MDNEKSKFILTFALIFVSVLSAFAQTPFEKGGKWGLKDISTNKTIVKPQYKALIPLSASKGKFMVQAVVDIPKIGKQLRWGVIDATGQVIVPVTAETIYESPNFYIVVVPEYERVGSGSNYYEAERRYSSGRLKSFGMFNSFWEKKIVDIYSTGWKKQSSFESGMDFGDWMILEYYRAYGCINLKTGVMIKPFYDDYFSEDVDTRILYNKPSGQNEGKALSITKNGKYVNGRVIKVPAIDGNVKGLVFVPVNSAGVITFDNITCEDIQEIKDKENYFSVKKDDKWGVYNRWNKELIVPFNLPAPITSLVDNNYVEVSFGDKSALYNRSGEFICKIGNGRLRRITDDFVFIERRDTSLTGVFSLKKKKWIVEPGVYDRVNSFSNGYFAVEVSPGKYKYINSSGVTLSVLENVKRFADYDDFIAVSTKNGKMGLLNRTTGKWILPCVFEDGSIAWGSGKGANRRIALCQSSSKGDLVSIYTVSGRKIVSKFFPYGTRRNVIMQFGKQYLYQSY